MTKQLKQKIKDELEKLPKEQQEAIASVDWGSITEEVGKKYSLLEEEIEKLQLEIGLVLISLVRIEYLPANIEINVGLNTEISEKIAKEVVKNIFTPISDKLNEIMKNSGRDKIASWKQNVNFIVSGGDYTAFMEERKTDTTQIHE